MGCLNSPLLNVECEQDKIWCSPTFENVNKLDIEDEDKILSLIASNHSDNVKLAASILSWAKPTARYFFTINNICLVVDEITGQEISGNPDGLCTITLRSQVKGEIPKAPNWTGESYARLYSYHNREGKLYLTAEGIKEKSIYKPAFFEDLFLNVTLYM